MTTYRSVPHILRHVERNFDPETIPFYWDSPDSIITANMDGDLMMTGTDELGLQAIDWQSAVIGIDGACNFKQGADARSSWGNFHGHNCRHNAYGFLSINLPQTRCAAEIYAALVALDRLQMLWGPNRRHIFLMTDSKDLWEGITNKMFEWRKNGFKEKDGTDVVHANLFRWLDDVIESLWAQDVVVRFWRVPLMSNRMARDLANEVLNDIFRVYGGPNGVVSINGNFMGYGIGGGNHSIVWPGSAIGIANGVGSVNGIGRVNEAGKANDGGPVNDGMWEEVKMTDEDGVKTGGEWRTLF
jgi:ribonuclease HI